MRAFFKNPKLMLGLLAVVMFLTQANHASAIPTEGKVGPQNNANGAQIIFRAGVEGQQMGSNVAGDYYEGARTGTVYTIKTASAGTSFTTAGTSPLGAGGTAWLALYNPTNSGLNLEIEEIKIAGVSGTPGVGGVWYNLGCSQAITAAQNATPVNSKDTSAGVAQGYTQTALTGSTALKEIGLSCYNPFAAAFASTALPPPTCVDWPQGKFIIAPGCVFAIESALAGTTHLAAGSITYRQAVP